MSDALDPSPFRIRAIIRALRDTSKRRRSIGRLRTYKCKEWFGSFFGRSRERRAPGVVTSIIRIISEAGHGQDYEDRRGNVRGQVGDGLRLPHVCLGDEVQDRAWHLRR